MTYSQVTFESLDMYGKTGYQDANVIIAIFYKKYA